MNHENIFGTDGIRGVVNKFPMTPEAALMVGKALGHVIKIGRKRTKVIVGKDTRISGDMIEHALASGLCSAGANVILAGVIPTPGVAFLTRFANASAGIMVSASHNPFSYNGIKIFSSDGYKLPDELEEKISEPVTNQNFRFKQNRKNIMGNVYEEKSHIERYSKYLRNLFPKNFSLLGLRIAVDCANGAAFQIAPSLFRECGAELLAKSVGPTGININEHCGAVFPEQIASFGKNNGVNLGISLDGDADRCMLSDENGEVVDGDQILGICAIDMAAREILKGKTIVTTPMSNIGLSLSLANYGISVVHAKVGDRHVVEMMKKNDFNLGGEQSGHVIFLDDITTGDGMLTALKVLDIMKRTNLPLSKLKKSIALLPQVRIDVPVKRKEPFAKHEKIKLAIISAELALKNRGRVLVRYSGTEPLARVMLEGESPELIHQHSQNIASRLQQVLN